MIAVFDVDGTLTAAALPLGFYIAASPELADMQPDPDAVARLRQHLVDGDRVVVLSSRSEMLRDVTCEWLQRNVTEVPLELVLTPGREQMRGEFKVDQVRRLIESMPDGGSLVWYDDQAMLLMAAAYELATECDEIDVDVRLGQTSLRARKGTR